MFVSPVLTSASRQGWASWRELAKRRSLNVQLGIVLKFFINILRFLSTLIILNMYNVLHSIDLNRIFQINILY